MTESIPTALMEDPLDLRGVPDSHLLLSLQVLVVTPDSVSVHAQRCSHEWYVFRVYPPDDCFGSLPLFSYLLRRQHQNLRQERRKHFLDFFTEQTRFFNYGVHVLL